MPRIPGAATGSRRGSVVIFVLGIILLAAFLITRLMDRASVELATESKATSRAGLRREALSALEASLAVLADQSLARFGLHDVSEGWAAPLELMEYQPSTGFVVKAQVEDESGKLSLPLANENALRGFLTAIECPLTSMDRLVDSLLLWTKPEYLSVEVDLDDSAMGGAALPYVAPGRALRSFAELRAIPVARELFFDESGEWNELGRRFQSGASLFAFDVSNVNSARAEVLLARGVDAGRVAAMVSARQIANDRSSFYKSSKELSSAWGPGAEPAGFGTESVCQHVIITVSTGASTYRLDAWVQPAGTALSPGARRQTKATDTTAPVATVRNNPRIRMDYPFEILEIREDDGT